MPIFEVEGVKRVGWTPEAVEQAMRAGLLDPDDRFEIIDGELFSKMGQGWPHRFAVDALMVAFRELDSNRYQQSVQMSLRVGRSNPEPDFQVLRGPNSTRTDLPDASEALFVVEVSDSSFAFDIRRKTPLYAGAGIPVYWIVDVANSCVIVHALPQNGAYNEIRTYSVGEMVPPPFEGAPSAPVASLFAPK